MTVLFKNLYSSSCLLMRIFYSTFSHRSYEGQGKTTVTVLNKNYDYGLMIDGISEHGFMINNGIQTVGPMIIFPKTMISWNIASSADMNEKSLSLFLHLDPKLDILLIGLDDNYFYNSEFLQNIRSLFKNQNIPTEILPVHKACSVFNFLNSENRYAAAALIPPKFKNRKDLILPNKTKNNVLE